MKRTALAAMLAACTVTPAFAQSSTAVGTGVGVAKSTSVSGAVAISGQGGQGGNGGNGGNVTVNGTPAVQTINSVASGTQTLKNVPTVFSPGLTAAGLETCLGSVSAGVGVVGTGVSVGSTIPDPECAARLDARTLWSMGLKKAAIARLCLRPDIYRSMPEVCVQYLPNYGAQPVALAPYRSAWLSSDANAKAAEPILLIDGSSGKERLCNDYDEPGQKCRVWAYATQATTFKPHKKKVAAVKPNAAPLPKLITDPPPAPPKAAETKESKSDNGNGF